MLDANSEGCSEGDRRLERAIVLQAIRDDHEPAWSRLDLELELGDTDPSRLDAALARLRDAGVLEIAEETVWASHATMHIDRLDLIAL